MIEQLRRLFGQAPDEYALDVQRVPNLATYQAHVARMGATHRERWLLELDLCKSGETFKTPGKCYPCRKDVVFTTDFEYSSAVVNGQRIPNWRERVLCSCQLNNRTRASIHILEGLLGANKRSSIYIAEQVTPLYEVLRKRFPKLVGSEYLGTKVPFGKTDERGVRNESITKLTLADASFDYVLNFDVLEHVPEPEQAYARFIAYFGLAATYFCRCRSCPCLLKAKYVRACCRMAASSTSWSRNITATRCPMQDVSAFKTLAGSCSTNYALLAFGARK